MAFDPAETAARYADRCIVFHAKDGVSSPLEPFGYTWCPFGQGDMPLEDFFRRVGAGQRRAYLNIEQDNGPGDGTGTLSDPQKSQRDAALSYAGLAALRRRSRGRG